MEIVAMDMKLRGMYIARQLSFTGVTFKIEEVLLSQSYVKMYNKAVKLVSLFSLTPSIFNVPDDVFVSFSQCNVCQLTVYFCRKTADELLDPYSPSFLCYSNLKEITIYSIACIALKINITVS